MPTMIMRVLRRRVRGTIRSAVWVALALPLSAGPGGAGEIRLLSAAAMQSVFKDVAGDFERTTGHKLVISYGTIGGISQRLQRAEEADFVIGSSLSMPVLAREGRIAPDSLVTICRTSIGVVVPLGSPKPRIVSTDDFRQALLAAKVLVYADPVRGGAAGVHIAKVLDRLGIAERLKSQITLGAGGDVTEVTVTQGDGALGMTQISEIVGKTSAAFVGPLPAELQNDTVFVGGLPAGAKPSDAVSAFVAFLKSPTAVAAITARGMQLD